MTPETARSSSGDPIRHEALLAWRAAKLKEGVRSADLPGSYDLRILSKADDISASPLMSKTVIRKWKTELARVWASTTAKSPEDAKPTDVGQADDAGRGGVRQSDDRTVGSTPTQGPEPVHAPAPAVLQAMPRLEAPRTTTHDGAQSAAVPGPDPAGVGPSRSADSTSGTVRWTFDRPGGRRRDADARPVPEPTAGSGRHKAPEARTTAQPVPTPPAHATTEGARNTGRRSAAVGDRGAMGRLPAGVGSEAAGRLMGPSAGGHEREAEAALPMPRDFPPCPTVFPADEETPTLRLEQRGERFLLCWDPGTEARVVYYRVGTSRRNFAVRPEDCEHTVLTEPFIDITRAVRCEDAAVQWVRVWRHEGADRPQALASPSQLVGQLAFVAPPRDVRFHVAGQDIVALWTVAADAVDVELYRLPKGSHLEWLVPEPTHVVTSGVDLQGYRGQDVPLGEWEYRLYAIARADGREKYSPPVTCLVDVRLPLRPVTELWVQRYGDGSLRVEWPTVVNGHVTIHATRALPEVSLGLSPLEESALELREPRLAIGAALPYAIRSGGDRQWIEGVRLSGPEGEYLSAVVRRGTQAWVGACQYVPRLAEVIDLRLHERVEAQLLTFGLPPRVRQVQVFVTTPGAVPDVERDGPIQSVDAEAFRRSGRVTLSQLSQGRPCTVHVVPVYKFSPPEVGPVASVEYPGLVRLAYRFDPAQEGPDTRDGRGAVRRFRRLRVKNLSPQDVVVQFYVCHNPLRLPLYLNDGELLTFSGNRTFQQNNVEVSLPSDKIVDVGVLDLPAGGFVRAFAEHVPGTGPDVPLALLDPALASLT